MELRSIYSYIIIIYLLALIYNYLTAICTYVMHCKYCSFSSIDEQVVPYIPMPELTKKRESLPPPSQEEEESKRKLPDVRVDSAKPLDLFGETREIFAHSREE